MPNETTYHVAYTAGFLSGLFSAIKILYNLAEEDDRRSAIERLNKAYMSTQRAVAKFKNDHSEDLPSEGPTCPCFVPDEGGFHCALCNVAALNHTVGLVYARIRRVPLKIEE